MFFPDESASVIPLFIDASSKATFPLRFHLIASSLRSIGSRFLSGRSHNPSPPSIAANFVLSLLSGYELPLRSAGSSSFSGWSRRLSPTLFVVIPSSAFLTGLVYHHRFDQSKPFSEVSRRQSAPCSIVDSGSTSFHGLGDSNKCKISSTITVFVRSIVGGKIWSVEVPGNRCIEEMFQPIETLSLLLMDP